MPQRPFDRAPVGPHRQLEASVPHNNLKTFAQAIQCLAKVGKELYIEGTSDKLVLRTLNDAKSAFAAFYFSHTGFFESFKCEVVPEQTQGPVDIQHSQAASQPRNITCKILLKAVHNIFRTLKKVLRLVIYIEAEDEFHIEPHLVFQMHCEHAIQKVHRFTLQGCEIMHAMFSQNGLSRLVCPPVQLSQLLDHIHGAPEVLFAISQDVVHVKSYHHASTAKRALLKTEMSISSQEFDQFLLHDQYEVVNLICGLKDVKALLQFCDGADTDTLHMEFTAGGAPMKLYTQVNTFTAELILATLNPDAGAPLHNEAEMRSDRGVSQRPAGGGGTPAANHQPDQWRSPPHQPQRAQDQGDDPYMADVSVEPSGDHQTTNSTPAGFSEHPFEPSQSQDRVGGQGSWRQEGGGGGAPGSVQEPLRPLYPPSQEDYNSQQGADGLGGSAARASHMQTPGPGRAHSPVGQRRTPEHPGGEREEHTETPSQLPPLSRRSHRRDTPPDTEPPGYDRYAPSQATGSQRSTHTEESPDLLYMGSAASGRRSMGGETEVDESPQARGRDPGQVIGRHAPAQPKRRRLLADEDCEAYELSV